MNIRFWSHRLWATVCVMAILLASLMWVGGRRFTDVSAVRAAGGLFSSYAPFWSVSRGFSSTLVLRNRQQSSLVATPVIYTSGGKQTRLDTIELQPGATEMVLLDTALPAAGVSAETGALAVEYAQPVPPLVGGEVVVRNDEQSLIFNFPLDAGFVSVESKTVQAAWWFPDEETSATVVLFNTSNEKVLAHPSVSVNGAARAFADVTLEPHEQQPIDLKGNLRDSGLHDAPLGLLTLSYDGPVNALHPALLLWNEKTGFSLTGKFLPKREAQPNEQTTWHFPAVFANRPGDEWGFKKGVTFTPYALLGNTTGNFLSLDLEAGDAEPGGSIVRSVSLPISPLAPRETRLVDLSEYIKHGLLSDTAGLLSVRLRYAGAAGDLTAQVMSIDKSGNFVFAAEGRMHPARAFEPLSWDIAGDRMSAIDVRNISPGDVQVRVTLTYNHGQGSYQAPLFALRGGESRMVNVKELVRASQQTSAEGAVPAGVTFGGAVIEAIGGESEAPLVAASTVFDPVRGTCGATPSCSTQDATVLLDGFALPTCDSLCPITSPCADCIAFTTVTISGNQSIKDGETAQFSVTVEGATATAYAWSFTAPSGAGNNPSVTFYPPNTSGVSTDGHWFANPNVACPTSADIPSYYNSVYTIKCKVTLDSGQTKTVTASFTVNALWDPAGFVDTREANLTGMPAMAQGADGVWRITGMGTLGRRIPTKHVLIPDLSQFFVKADAHEQEHINHWDAGNLFGGVFQPGDFFLRIQNFTGSSEQDLLGKVNAEKTQYVMEQRTFVSNNLTRSEQLAFQVSDPISPQYVYQNCGRF